MPAYPKPLPAFRQLDLVARAQRGDRSARDLLVTSNMAFVHSEARKLAARHPEMELDDLVQEGATGLMHAVDKFDAAAGVLFLTYAGHWVRQRMSRFCAKAGSVSRYGARVPDGVYHALPRVARAQARLEREWGRVPTIHEIAAELELSVDCVEQAQRLLTAPPLVDVEDGETRDWVMDQPDPNADTVEEAADSEQNAVIARLVGQLTDDERQVIIRRFGLDGAGAVSESELGQEMGVSRARLQSLRAQALKRMRSSEISQQLRDHPNAQLLHMAALRQSCGHMRDGVSQEQLAKLTAPRTLAGRRALMGSVGGTWWLLSRNQTTPQWKLAIASSDGEMMDLSTALRTLRGKPLSELIGFVRALPLQQHERCLTCG